jgi:hypothetical protein
MITPPATSPVDATTRLRSIAAAPVHELPAPGKLLGTSDCLHDDSIAHRGDHALRSAVAAVAWVSLSDNPSAMKSMHSQNVYAGADGTMASVVLV